MPLSILRRAIFVMIPAFFTGMSCNQIQLLMFLSFLYMIWYANYRPHYSSTRTRLEIFNEAMILVCCYHMFIFSNFAMDLDMQFYFGYVYVCVIGIVLIINLRTVIVSTIRTCRYRMALKAKRDRFKKEAAEAEIVNKFSKKLDSQLERYLASQPEEIREKMREFFSEEFEVEEENETLEAGGLNEEPTLIYTKRQLRMRIKRKEATPGLKLATVREAHEEYEMTP
jgi:hypothetical protein